MSLFSFPMLDFEADTIPFTYANATDVSTEVTEGKRKRLRLTEIERCWAVWVYDIYVCVRRVDSMIDLQNTHT